MPQNEDILSLAAQRDDEFQQQREAGMAKVGLPQPERTPMRLPSGPESTDAIRDVIANMKPGDPQNTRILQREYEKIGNELEFLNRNKPRGVLEGLKGPRKWNVALNLALNPGLRKKINAQFQAVHEERVMRRRNLMLQLGQELRTRNTDPVKQAQLVAFAKKVGAQQGEDFNLKKNSLIWDKAVEDGVIDEYDRNQLDRIGFGLKENTRVPPATQIKSALEISNSSMRAVAGLTPQGVEAYTDVLREMGVPVNETWHDLLLSKAAATQKDKSTKDETPAAMKSRLMRETASQWKENMGIITEISKEAVWVNERMMKAEDPDAEWTDDGAIIKHISVWTPEELKAATYKLSLTSGYDPELFRRFWNPGDDEVGEIGPDDTWTEADEKALQEKLGGK